MSHEPSLKPTVKLNLASTYFKNNLNLNKLTNKIKQIILVYLSFEKKIKLLSKEQSTLPILRF